MRLTLRLRSTELTPILPINYAYPLSAAIYKILAYADSEYTSFLHERGYGKGFKLFSFSQLNCSFRLEGDRMVIVGSDISFVVTFHISHAAEAFVRGLFESANLTIGDKHSKATFQVQSVEGLPDPLQAYNINEVIKTSIKPLSPIVAGIPNQKGIYDFLSPHDSKFITVLIHNWRNKIAASWDENIASNALLIVQLGMCTSPPKSRLITIKADTMAQSKIRGWMNFELHITAEKRFLELLFNAGVGLYNAQGMGCIQHI